MDRNGDGKVTYQDIEEICIKYLCPQQPDAYKPLKANLKLEDRLEVARKLFRQYDKNGTGFLSINEVKQLIGDSYKYPLSPSPSGPWDSTSPPSPT